MPKGTTKSKFKLTREITDSEMLNHLKNSMTPIFSHFEEEINSHGGSGTLHIELTATPGKLNLKYGVNH